MSTSGGAFTVSADATYSGTITWGSNNAGSSFNFTTSWATYAEITGTFAPGPLTASIGTALLYLDMKPAVNVSFTQTPAITVTTSGSFPGSQCDFAVYGNPGSGGGGTNSWFSATAVGVSEVAPSGNTFTVPATTLPPPNTVDFQANQDTYVALYCH